MLSYSGRPVERDRGKHGQGSKNQERKPYTERLRSSLIALISILRRPILSVKGVCEQRYRSGDEVWQNPIETQPRSSLQHVEVAPKRCSTSVCSILNGIRRLFLCIHAEKPKNSRSQLVVCRDKVGRRTSRAGNARRVDTREIQDGVTKIRKKKVVSLSTPLFPIRDWQRGEE
jgi:hypothetical protein